jgi:serine/threonine-protein kinase
MDASRVERVAALFDRALAVPRAERLAFLQAACGGDDELRQEVHSLLEAHETSSGFFEDLAAGVVAPVSAAVVAQGLADLMPELERLLSAQYRIERELGGGGMSRVFLAEELALGRKVVIKVLPPEPGASVSAERFRREIQLAAQLQHPHIVPLLTGDSSSRLLYYTMPFITGESLRTRLGRDGALPVQDASRIWRDVLDALAYAHAHGVVHRDIKPGNVLLGGRYAMVSDFGIARAVEAAAGDADATGPGLAIGTPAYMAPEQVRGDAGADHRADIYAAGLVMYEMLEGRLPFAGTSPRELLLARLTDAPRPIGRVDCPSDLAAAVLRCLARDPADRPASAEALLAGLESPSTATDSATRMRAPLRRLLPFAAAVAALGVVGFGVSHLGRGSAAAPPPGVATASVAVLPLANLSAGEADAALADGMTEELIGILSREGRLRIVASTSVRALQERRLEVRQIAESLRVSHVLEGALQKAGSKLRMQVRLVDARDGSTRWSATYDREIGDIFAVQDEIARAVAGELDVQLAAGGVAASQRRRHTLSITAYEWYLRGKQTSLLRTSGGRRQGIEYLRRALAADSNFAAAYAGLTWLYLNEAGSSPGDYRRWEDRARAVARKAVALDSSLAEAHSALGWAEMAPSDWSPSETALARAVALDPAVYRGYEGLARVYMHTRRPAEQIAAARRGLEVDPFSVQATREMALALSMNGRCDEALELLRPLKALTPPAGVAGVIRGQCYARKQMWPEAIAELRWAMETTDARVALALLGYALARGGRSDEARQILGDLLAGRKRSHGAFGIAVVHTGLRDYDQAFAWLEKSVEEGSLRVYIMDPLFDDLHRDPRFDRLFGPPQKR